MNQFNTPLFDFSERLSDFKQSFPKSRILWCLSGQSLCWAKVFCPPHDEMWRLFKLIPSKSNLLNHYNYFNSVKEKMFQVSMIFRNCSA
jgi:hypothetical protein